MLQAAISGAGWSIGTAAVLVVILGREDEGGEPSKKNLLVKFSFFCLFLSRVLGRHGTACSYRVYIIKNVLLSKKELHGRNVQVREDKVKWKVIALVLVPYRCDERDQVERRRSGSDDLFIDQATSSIILVDVVRDDAHDNDSADPLEEVRSSKCVGECPAVWVARTLAKPVHCSWYYQGANVAKMGNKPVNLCEKE